MMEACIFYMVEARLLCVMETVESLDITLDNQAGLHKWILMDSWI